MVGLGLPGHRDEETGSDKWFTPRAIVDALGPFDLDPCSSADRPWPTAARHIEHTDIGGLLQVWHGRVWCNPPYSASEDWLRRCAEHGNAIALTFARTDTQWFRQWVWQSATALLFIEGRLRFHNPDGSLARWDAGAPSVLIAYDRPNALALEDRCPLPGHFIALTPAARRILPRGGEQGHS